MSHLATKLWKIALVVLGVLVLAGALQYWRDSRVTTQQCDGLTLAVNDSTQAQCAKLRANTKELGALRAAAKDMHGDLVAGTKIIIQRDTITKVIHDVVTVTDSSGTRTATLADTTQDYQVSIKAEAPPKGNLRIGYTVITPERSVEVGFVKRPDGYYAVATGRGVKTAESFFAPPSERPLSLVAGGGIRGGPKDNLIGASLRYDAYAAVQYAHRGLDYQLRLGHDGSPYVGIAAQKRIW